MPLIGATDAHLQRGEPLRLALRHAPHLPYWLYRPVEGAGPCLVTVHGISRNAEEHLAAFRDAADRYGVTLVAPVFARDRFPDYQRLGRAGRGTRADLALLAVLAEIERRADVSTDRIDLFGFSGGAQFAHRFAFLHPDRVRRLMLGAPGWYTLPHAGLPYPYGVGDTAGLEGGAGFDLRAILAIPVSVYVGALDAVSSKRLNRDRRVRVTQGGNRLERARRWVELMNRQAELLGLPPPARLTVLRRTGHSFRQAVRRGRLAERLFSLLELESATS